MNIKRIYKKKSIFFTDPTYSPNNIQTRASFNSLTKKPLNEKQSKTKIKKNKKVNISESIHNQS